MRAPAAPSRGTGERSWPGLVAFLLVALTAAVGLGALAASYAAGSPGTPGVVADQSDQIDPDGIDPDAVGEPLADRVPVAPALAVAVALLGAGGVVLLVRRSS